MIPALIFGGAAMMVTGLLWPDKKKEAPTKKVEFEASTATKSKAPVVEIVKKNEESQAN